MDTSSHRVERVVLDTATHRITGDLTLARDGYRSRLSDVLNANERDFLSLTDATIEPHGGGEGVRHAFLAVSRRHVVTAAAHEG